MHAVFIALLDRLAALRADLVYIAGVICPWLIVEGCWRCAVLGYLMPSFALVSDLVQQRGC